MAEVDSDWTRDESGRSNSSETFLALVEEVAALLHRNGGHCLDERWVRSAARLIMAQVAHVHRLAPPSPGPAGVWLAYHADWSRARVFATKADADAHAVEHSMSTTFWRFGEDDPR